MGAIYGLWLAQYEVLREHGHSPSEAFNETVEEATQSLYPLIAEKGMDWMYANCSTTAQRGALDWFKAFRDASQAGVREAVPGGREWRRDRARAGGEQPAGLPRAAGEGAEGGRRQRDVAGGNTNSAPYVPSGRRRELAGVPAGGLSRPPSGDANSSHSDTAMSQYQHSFLSGRLASSMRFKHNSPRA